MARDGVGCIADSAAGGNAVDIVDYLFRFHGRIARRHFWFGMAAWTILCIVLAPHVDTLFTTIFAVRNRADPLAAILAISLAGAVTLFTAWPILALTAKRLHDRDRSGWWCLYALVPLAGQIWLVVEAGCRRGTVGPNWFGTDPAPVGAVVSRPSPIAAAVARTAVTPEIAKRMAVLAALHVQGVISDQELAQQREALVGAA